MKLPVTTILILSMIVQIIFGCTPKHASKNNLTERERSICDSLHIDYDVITEIRRYNLNEIDPFQYSFGNTQDATGKFTAAITTRLDGIIFGESHNKVYNLLDTLKNALRKKGYTIFLLDANFDHDGEKDIVAVVKTLNKYQILKEIGTNGINYGIDNDSLL